MKKSNPKPVASGALALLTEPASSRKQAPQVTSANGEAGPGRKAELNGLRRGLCALRYLNIVNCVSANAMARALQVPHTTARRILDTLVAESCAEQIPYSNFYRLAPA